MDGYWPVIGIALAVAVALPATITLVMIKLSKPKLGSAALCNTQLDIPPNWTIPWFPKIDYTANQFVLTSAPFASLQLGFANMSAQSPFYLAAAGGLYFLLLHIANGKDLNNYRPCLRRAANLFTAINLLTGFAVMLFPDYTPLFVFLSIPFTLAFPLKIVLRVNRELIFEKLIQPKVG